MSADQRFDGNWVVTAYRSDGELLAPDEGSDAMLTIDDGRASGTMGVNRLVGRWEDGVMAVPLATTMMAGPPELMEQERVLLENLQTFDAIEVVDDGMIFRRDGLVLVELERKGTAERFPSS